MAVPGTLRLLPPEVQLLVLAARTDVADEDLAAAMRDVRSWPAVLQLAERERACGVLWHRLAPHAAPGDGAVRRAGSVARLDALATLRRLGLVERFRGQALQARLQAALRTLETAGVPVLLLKGSALGSAVYSTFEQRAMSDVDLLVAPERAGAARDALLASGWNAGPYVDLVEFYGEHHHLPPLVDARNPTVVLELHTDLLTSGHPFDFGAVDAWREARPLPGESGSGHVPSTHVLALHACLHLSWSHAMESAGWRTFRDLAALRAHGGLEWHAFARAAEGAAAQRAVYWPLALGRSLGLLDVPDAVLAQLQPALPERVRAALVRHFAVQLFVRRRACPSLRVQRALWTLAMRPSGGWGDARRPWSRNALFRPLHADREPSALRGWRAWAAFLATAVAGRPVR